MIEMSRRRVNNASHTMTVWLDLLAQQVGSDAYGGYDALRNATLYIPAPNSLGDDYILRPRAQEQFYLGVDERSYVPSGPGQVVKSLDLKSRAAVEGGLRETDILTLNSTVLWLAEEFEHSVTLTVLREVDGAEVEVVLTWWPRTWTKVKSFQWEKMEE
jgi:hypothetical protein